MNESERIQQLKFLWHDLANDSRPTQRIKIRNGVQINVGFVNQFALHSFIPNKWFDWERRANAEIMIIGQDWGPYAALEPYLIAYEAEKDTDGFDYDEYLFRTFSSRTEKFIFKSLEKSYLEVYNRAITMEIWDKFIFTVAVFFTRQGKHFRGSEFYDEKYGVELSLPYLTRQIDIVKPKVIIPLGGTAWGMVRSIFELKQMPGKISDVVNSLNGKPIIVKNTAIIPNFHPASHTDPKIQYEIWKTVWNY
jgi:hypothetical protein